MWLEALVRKSGLTEEVVLAKTTEESKALIDAKNIDFAFIDYEMPTEDGPAIISYLKSKNPSAHIALVSASNSQRYQEESTAAGAESYICTTFEEDVVLKNISDLLNKWLNS